MNSEKLRRLIFETRVKQKDLAQVAGVSEAFLSNCINGKSIPSVAVLIRIADFFGVTVDELARSDMKK